jgi:hypothetical protein
VAALVEAGAGVAVHAADVRGALERAVEAVEPRVVGAAQAGLDPRGGVDEPAPAVAADVVEHARGAVAVAQQDQRPAEQFHRLDIARLRRVASEADGGPGAREELVALGGQRRRVRVEAVGQALRRRGVGEHRLDRAGQRVGGGRGNGLEHGEPP